MNKRMKMNLKKLLALATLFIIYGSNLSAKDYTVSSPNGKNVATVDKGLYGELAQRQECGNSR